MEVGNLTGTIGVVDGSPFLHAHVVLGGPYPGLSDRILLNAFALNRKDGLAGLTIVYVSNARPSFELAEAASEVHAHLLVDIDIVRPALLDQALAFLAQELARLGIGQAREPVV